MEFVTFEEAKTRLGKTDEQLQEMIKSGQIRAFRDGAAWKFRKADIDAMAPAAAPASAVSPGEADGPAPQAAGAGPAGEEMEEDAGDTLMSIDADILFAEEEEVPADSAAETWIAADTEGVFPSEAAPGEEKPLGVEEALTAPEAEPAPLALSPETDESSLQEVLSEEEIAEEVEGDVFAEEPVIAVDTESGVASVVPSSATRSGVAASRTRIVTLVEGPAHHASFTVMLGMTTVALGFTVFVLVALLAGAKPGLVMQIGESSAGVAILAVGIFITGVVTVVGLVLEKQRKAREAMSGQ
ncbi:MAG TPA: helix-turn-helix domain-containing protein [Phycisphaerae bacterium]|nr:helix-turn-helix domain-containing protein [Phycisphaerae bacterium]